MISGGGEKRSSMKKASLTTYKVGTNRQFAAWTKRVVRDARSARTVPKKWFDSEASAPARGSRANVRRGHGQPALSRGTWPCSMRSARRHPASMRELASLNRPKEASLSAP